MLICLMFITAVRKSADTEYVGVVAARSCVCVFLRRMPLSYIDVTLMTKASRYQNASQLITKILPREAGSGRS